MFTALSDLRHRLNLSDLRYRLTFWNWITLGAAALFFLLLVWPLINLVMASFAPARGPAAAGADFSVWETYGEFFTFRYYYGTLINSAIVSVLATLFAVAIGFPLAYLVSRVELPGKLFIRAAVVLTFVSPPFIGAYAWILLLGRNGLFTRAFETIGVSLPSVYGAQGIVLVFTLQAFPFVFLLVSSGLRSIDQSLEDAAINLGQTRLGALRTVILPLMVPSISTGALLVFVTTFSDFGTPMIIGEGFRVLAALIYSEFINEFGGNPRVASTLSVILLTVTVGALLIQRAYAKRASYGQEAMKALGVFRLPRAGAIAATTFVYGIVLLAFLPTLTIVVSSFLEARGPILLPSFSLEGYRLARRLPLALQNSMIFVTIATILCVVVGSLIGYVVSRQKGRLAAAIDTMSMIPFAVAGVVLGVSLSITFGGAPFFLAGSATILILAYFIRRLPYTVRSVSGMLHQTGEQQEEASINLGVVPGLTFLWITVPQITPALMSGALLTWATTAREFNSTVMLYVAQTRTLPVEVFTQVLQGNFGAASVVGTVLIMTTVVPIVVLFRVFGKDEEFLV
jgi:iron(III) transport system permease protein